MSANWFGNDSQGYFGSFFGPIAPAEGNFVSESVTVADASSATVSYVVSRQESLSILDASLGIVDILVALTESVTVSDSSSVAVAFLSAVSESLAVTSTEGAQADFFAELAESVSTEDTQSSVSVISVAVEEAGLSVQDLQDGQTNETSVSESVLLLDSSDSSVIPNPTPPNPQPKETTMPPGAAGAAIDRSRARPLRYNYDGEVKIKLFPNSKNVFGLVRDGSKSKDRVFGIGFRPVKSFFGGAAPSKIGSFSKCLGFAQKKSTSKSISKSSDRIRPVSIKITSSKSKSKGFSYGRGTTLRVARAGSSSKGFSSISGCHATSFGGAKSFVKGHSIAAGNHSVEFSAEQMELIFALAQKEYFDE